MILDGKLVSEKMLEDMKNLVNPETNNTLAIVTLGEDEASKTYVNTKKNKAKNLGLKYMHISLSETTTFQMLEDVINDLNFNDLVKGIIIQKPLPTHLARFEDRVDQLIQVNKDIDGFNPTSDFTACTPKGIMTLLDYYKVNTDRKFVVIAGRSKTVGLPLAKLFQDRNCTVVNIHSKTPFSLVKQLVSSCDIFVSAIGRPHYWKEDLFRPCLAYEGQKKIALIDVGINRVDGKLMGDVDPEVYKHFKYYTPVPGGVGPMTVASLLENLMDA